MRRFVTIGSIVSSRRCWPVRRRPTRSRGRAHRPSPRSPRRMRRPGARPHRLSQRPPPPRRCRRRPQDRLFPHRLVRRRLLRPRCRAVPAPPALPAAPAGRWFRPCPLRSFRLCPLRPCPSFRPHRLQPVLLLPIRLSQYPCPRSGPPWPQASPVRRLRYGDSDSAASGSADSGSAASGSADSGSADSGSADSGSADSGSADSGSARLRSATPAATTPTGRAGRATAAHQAEAGRGHPRPTSTPAPAPAATTPDAGGLGRGLQPRHQRGHEVRLGHAQPRRRVRQRPRPRLDIYDGVGHDGQGPAHARRRVGEGRDA